MIASDWQPDPARGVFETLLVIGGAPVEPEAHLKRLSRSVEALYSLRLPDGANEQLALAAAGMKLGRLRVSARPSAREVTLGIKPDAVERAIVFPSAGVRLKTQPLRGGLGPHKWIDRRGIERPAANEAGALLVDEGEVLEAGWANIFAVRDGTLFTPPLGGRILPGTTRAALLALAADAGIETAERPLRPSNLLAAEETFLSSSIRGIEAVLELDGEPLPGCGPLSRRLAAALRRRWGLASDWGDPATPAAAPKLGQPAR